MPVHACIRPSTAISLWPVSYTHLDVYKRQVQIHLAAQANAAIDAGSKPSELELGRWNEYRAQVSACLEKKRRYLGQMDLNLSLIHILRFC